MSQIISDFFVKTVDYVRQHVTPVELPDLGEPLYLAVDDVEIAQMALRYRLCRCNQVSLQEAVWNGLDEVKWAGLAAPKILNDYLYLRHQDRPVKVVALDYDLSEGDNITVLDGVEHAWNGADLAVALRLLEQKEGLSPVLICPNSVHRDNNDKILQAASAASGRDEEAEGTVSTVYRLGNNKCAFLEIA